MVSSGEAKQVAFITSKSLSEAKEGLVALGQRAKIAIGNRMTSNSFLREHPAIMDWAKQHRIASVVGGITAFHMADEAVAGAFLWGRHKRKQLNRMEDERSATIAYSKRGMSKGSAAGLRNPRSAWLQPDNQGYDNPQIQSKRHGITYRAARSVPNPTITRPVGTSIGSNMLRDTRNRPTRTMDDKLSNMF